MFLLGAGYTLLHNEHVRIDVIFGHLSPRAQAWIDLFGGIFFLLPMAVIIMVLSLAGRSSNSYRARRDTRPMPAG